MAATGKTPILLYGSTTASNVPSAGNLTNSSDGCEIAINVADKNLFFKDSTNAVNTVPIRQSSASSNGWLSSTDWSTFNGKAPAFTYTSGYIPYGQGTTTPTQSSSLTFNGTTLATNSFTATGTSLVGYDGGQYTNQFGVSSLIPYLAQYKWTGSGSNYYATKVINNNGVWTLQTAAAAAVGSHTFANVVTVDQSGNQTLSTGNLVIGTSGKGIDFSATPGTGTSELLADYEEGTWTPAILTYGGGASDPTFTGLVVSGRYTKIGRQVTATGRMYWTGRTGGAGLVAIQGLPYTIASEDGFMGVMKYNTTYQAGTGVAYTIYAQNLMPRFYQAGYDRIKFGYAMSGNITGDLAVSDLINSTQYFEFSVTYFN